MGLTEPIARAAMTLSRNLRSGPLLREHGRFRAAVRGAYRRGLLLLTGGRGPLVTVNGTDRFRFVSRYSDRIEWEPELYARLDELLAPGMIVVDIGAHDGLFAMAMAGRIAPSGVVHAIEPAPDSFEALGRNVRNNGLADRVRGHNLLVGEREDEIDFFWMPGGVSLINSPIANIGGPDIAPRRTVRRKVVTLDSWAAAEGVTPDLLKIDVEGFELNVIRGARGIISGGNPPLIIMEVHTRLLRELGQSVDELLGELRGLGYDIEDLREHNHPEPPPAFHIIARPALKSAAAR